MCIRWGRQISERLDWWWGGGLLISQASVCVGIYSHTSCFQTLSDGICFCPESRVGCVGKSRAHALKLLRGFPLMKTELREYHNTDYTSTHHMHMWGKSKMPNNPKKIKNPNHKPNFTFCQQHQRNVIHAEEPDIPLLSVHETSPPLLTTTTTHTSHAHIPPLD